MPNDNELVYKEILDVVPSIVLGLDKKGDIFLLNQRGCDILEYERDEIIGKNWFSTCLPSEVVPEIKKMFKRLMAGTVEQAEKVENKVITKSGRLIDIFWRNILLKDDQGLIIGTLSSGEDLTDYKKKEEEFRLMNQSLENSPVMAYRLKAEKGRVAFAYISGNSRRLGYSLEEFMALDPLSLVHPEDRERVERDMKKHLKDDSVKVEQEYRVIAKDGQVHWINDLVEIIRDQKGEAQYFQGTFIDITEHKEVEEKMKEANIVLENSPAVLYRARLSEAAACPIEFVSGNVSQFGFASADFLGWKKGLLEAIYPPDLPKFVQDLKGFIDHNNPDEYLRTEYRIVAKDGQKHWVEDLSKLIINESGQATHLRGLIIDISERKAMEEKIKEVALVLKNTPAILYRVRLVENWPIEFVSDNVRSFGYEPADFANGRLTTADITHPDDLARIFGEMVAFAESNPAPGTHLRQEYRVITKDKKVRHVEDFSEIIRDAEGKPAYYQGLVLDITERKEAEEKVRWADMIIEHSPAILFRWRAAENWPVEFVSDNIRRLGYTPEEFTSGATSYLSIIHPEDRERAKREAESYSGSGASGFHQEYRLITKDKEDIWIDNLMEVIRDINNKIIYYQGVIIDITERKVIEENLRLRTEELERANSFMVNRELKMVELKDRIKQLEEEKAKNA